MIAINMSPSEALVVISTVLERKCEVPADTLTSRCKRRDLTDARMASYKILRDTFGLSYVKIGGMFRRNHATIISGVNKHNDLYGRDKKYTLMFDVILRDVKKRVKFIWVSNMKDGKLKLKTLNSSEHEKFDVMLTTFSSKLESTEFMRNIGVLDEHIVYHGQPELMSDVLAQQVVSNDERRYVLETMKKSMDPLKSIMNVPVDRFYFNYTDGEFSFMNDAIASFNSAMSLFQAKDIVLIYLRPTF